MSQLSITQGMTMGDCCTSFFTGQMSFLSKFRAWKPQNTEEKHSHICSCIYYKCKGNVATCKNMRGEENMSHAVHRSVCFVDCCFTRGLMHRRLRTCSRGWWLRRLSVSLVLWQAHWSLPQVRLWRLRRQWKPISLQRSVWAPMSHQQADRLWSW